MRAVTYAGAGGNEVVRIEDRPDPVAGAEEVVVRASFAGLNPADVLQREGRYPAPAGSPQDVPGLEVCGVVESCGDRVTAWAPGDRVFGIVGGGGLAERVLVHERCLARVPAALDDQGAAAVPEAFVAAHDAIRTQARLAPGETLLVHGAAGAVGTAAIQIGALVGARVLAAVRSEQGREAVEALGAEPVSDDGFADAVLEKTGGRGADVILELVGAPHFPLNLEAAATGVRIVVVGVGAGQDAEIPLLRVMQKRASIIGTVLRSRPLEEKAAAVRAFERELLPAFESGRLRPLVDSVFAADEIHAALDRVAASGKIGNVLLSF
jgi:NADPH:quinone reductase-like Zn-dependent oxidoreductase